MEHRWGNRFRSDLRTRLFVHPASAGCGLLRDISISGGFIETRLAAPLLSTLCVQIESKATRSPRLLHARVVRRDADGVGVEWFDDEAEAVVAMVRESTAARMPERRVHHLTT